MDFIYAQLESGVTRWVAVNTKKDQSMLQAMLAYTPLKDEHTKDYLYPYLINI